MRVQELLDATGMPEAELKRHVQGLVLGKYRLLTKVCCGCPGRHAFRADAHRPVQTRTRTVVARTQEGKSKDIDPAERLSFNAQFTASLVRLKIQQIAMRTEADPERKEMQSRVEESRKYEYPLGAQARGVHGVQRREGERGGRRRLGAGWEADGRTRKGCLNAATLCVRRVCRRWARRLARSTRRLCVS